MIFPSSAKKKSEPIIWKGRPLEEYTLVFSMDRLLSGVDNFHIDVHLSPDFCKALTLISLQLLVGYSKSEEILKITQSSTLAADREEFKRCYRVMMLEAINLARQKNEVQIDYMAMTATMKKVLKEVRGQFDFIVEKFNALVWEFETSKRRDMYEVLELKEKNADFRKQKKDIIDKTCRDIFQYMHEVQAKDLRETREAKLGKDSVLPVYVFFNPLLQTDQISSEVMLAEYMMLGRRLDDADRYEPLLATIGELLTDIDFGRGLAAKDDVEGQEARKIAVDGWLKEVNTFEVLLNWFSSEEKCQQLKVKKGNEDVCRTMESRIAEQKKILEYFYDRFEATGLIDKVTASYEIQDISGLYCPPLALPQVLHYLIEPGSRKEIEGQLERFTKVHGKAFSLAPLQEKSRTLGRIKTREKQERLLSFLKGFSRYHRDLENSNVIRAAMERVSLVDEEKILNLSRSNNTLYEFLLPEEQVLDLFGEENQVVHHVIIKADLRGATDITAQLLAKKLNPASHFSLNFFDPVSGIISEYGAEKVFIEGDAIILVIYERQGDAKDSYSVARACGLAVTVLNIIKQYNVKSLKFNLPVLELGFGITYRDAPPTYLFDGDNRIMISPAINLAARLSNCSKPLRRLLDSGKYPFNVCVYQTVSDEEIAATGDDLFWRYNVNGIELGPDAFKKLTQEIELKAVDCVIPELHKEKIRLFIGKFPVVSGKFQRLVIRENDICEVSSDDLGVVRQTGRKYYEVCTHPALYEYARKVS